MTLATQLFATHSRLTDEANTLFAKLDKIPFIAGPQSAMSKRYYDICNKLHALTEAMEFANVIPKRSRKNWRLVA